LSVPTDDREGQAAYRGGSETGKGETPHASQPREAGMDEDFILHQATGPSLQRP
jgi:hypothetical protein